LALNPTAVVEKRKKRARRAKQEIEGRKGSGNMSQCKELWLSLRGSKWGGEKQNPSEPTPIYKDKSIAPTESVLLLEYKGITTKKKKRVLASCFERKKALLIKPL